MKTNKFCSYDYTTLNKVHRVFFNWILLVYIESKNAEIGSKVSLTADAEKSQGRYIVTSWFTRDLNGKQRQKAVKRKRIMVIVKVITPTLFMIVILCS